MAEIAEGKVTAIPVVTQDDGSAIATFIDEQQKGNGDQRLGRDVDDADEGGNAGGGESETERSRSAKRRDRARRARDGRETEIVQLRTAFGAQQQLIDTLFQGQGQQSLQMLESEAEKAKAAYAEAEHRKAKAIEAGNGEAVTEADRVITNATNYYNNVALQHANLARRLKEVREGGAQQQQQQGQRIELTNRGKELRDQFIDDHDFIDFGKNDDTATAIKAIDARVAAEGFDPNSKDYWDEVSDRLKKTMPHLFKGGSVRDRDDDDDDDARRARRRNVRRSDDDDDDVGERRRGGPPLGDAGRGERRRTDDVRLSPSMVDALDQAGLPLTGGSPEQIKRRNNILQSWKDNRPQQGR